MKMNWMLVAAAVLAVAPFVVSAAPASRAKGRNAPVEGDVPDFSKPDPKPAGAKAGDRGKTAQPEAAAKGKAVPAAAKKPAANPNAVVFDPPPPLPDEAAIAKAKKQKRPFYMKFAEAKDVAWKCQQPLVVALLPAGIPLAQTLEQKVLKDRMFAKDFVPANCVLLVWRLKPGKIEDSPEAQGRRRNGPPPRPTTIDARPLKKDEAKFLTAFAVTPEARAAAQRNNGEAPKFTDMRNYPAIICVNPAGSKLLFRAPRFEADKGKAGFGAWMSQVVDLFRGAQCEPVLTPALQKIVDNPTEPKKWK